MKAETLADYRTRIADRTLITLSVVSIERILDERLRLLDLVHRLRGWDHLDGAHDGPYWKNEIDKVMAYADEPVP